MADDLEERIAAYKRVCERIIEMATTASQFPASGLAKSYIDDIVGQCRRAHVISEHRMGMGSTFMDMPDANIFRFSEPMQLEYHDTHVAQVRGRKSPFLPEPTE